MLPALAEVTAQSCAISAEAKSMTTGEPRRRLMLTRLAIDDHRGPHGEIVDFLLLADPSRLTKLEVVTIRAVGRRRI